MGLNLVSDFTVDEQIQALYIAYFDRAAGPDGLAYWHARYDAERGDDKPAEEILTQFASAFADVEEARTAFPFLDAPATKSAADFVESVYQALFDRAPEGSPDDPTSGFGYWTERITEEVRTDAPIGDSVLSIFVAARNDDQKLVANKIAAADAYTDRLVQEGADYDQAAATGLLDRIKLDMTEAEAREVTRFEPAEPDAVTATVDLAEDPSFAGLESQIEASVREALDNIVSLLEPAPGNIEIAIDAIDSEALATGGSTYFSTDTAPEGGVYSVFANQLITGEDTNGRTGVDSADVFVNLSRQNLDDLDFGDGDGDFSAVNVFAHELVHGLGVASFVDAPETSIMTVWDTYLEPEGDGRYVFTGPTAIAVNGGQPVPLDDGPAHLSEAAFTTALMTPKAEFGGGEEITDIDVAILADIGLPVADSFAFV